ncbi:hypothetical protein [Arcanobacterium hippocoleae]|uniref:hypothetical protein n=1 Tax=Arcanobacterium hippocoleae TaxID=149017 RepID=UPI0033423A59
MYREGEINIFVITEFLNYITLLKSEGISGKSLRHCDRAAFRAFEVYYFGSQILPTFAGNFATTQS